MKRNARQSVSGGFTLVELLVVVGIIALLAAIMLPTFGKAKDSARRVASKATIAALDSACEAYAGENSNQYPVSAAATTNHQVVRHCSYSDGHIPPPSDFTFQYKTGVTYPGACLLFDRLARNIDDATGNPAPTRSKSAAYDVGGLKTAQMKHPSGSGTLVDASYFLDSYDNPILYYNFCDDPLVHSGTAAYWRYWDEHNPADARNNVAPPAAIDLPWQAAQATPLVPLAPVAGAPYSMRWRIFDAQPGIPLPPPAYEYYRGVANVTNSPHFILISPGRDRKYTPASANPATAGNGSNFKYDPNTDDVTNFSLR